MKTLFTTGYGRGVCLNPREEGTDWVTSRLYQTTNAFASFKREARVHALIDERETPPLVLNVGQCDCTEKRRA